MQRLASIGTSAVFRVKKDVFSGRKYIFPVDCIAPGSRLVDPQLGHLRSLFIKLDGNGPGIWANVRDHRHRTAGATDAGEERASASGVPAGRCSVDRIVRIFIYKLGVLQLSHLLLRASHGEPCDI